MLATRRSMRATSTAPHSATSSAAPMTRITLARSHDASSTLRRRQSESLTQPRAPGGGPISHVPCAPACAPDDGGECVALINHICLDCSRMTPRRTRCAECEARRNRERDARRTHRHGSYQAQARRVRESASVCWICGKGARLGDPFTADHVLPANPDSILLPAHRSCNSRRGDRV